MRRFAVALTLVAVAVGASIAHSAGSVKPPTGLKAKAGVEKVTLTWNASGSKHVSGYRVYRRRANGTWPRTARASTRATTRRYVDRGVTAGTTYAYRVVAVK